ncbi:MAG: hypothetical protein ACRDRI_01540 [Pseudonocardiaceae bacterium]
MRAIRDALTSVDGLLGELDDADPPDLADLDRAVSVGTLVQLDAADLVHVATREALRLAASAPDPLRVHPP